MNRLIDWTKGNPGAMSFMFELLEPRNFHIAIPIAEKLDDLKTIRGTNLYILWNDLANRDLQIVHNLCMKCPNDVLEDACNRQDYSGRSLVSKYIH